VRIVNYHPRARVGDGGITHSVRRLSHALADHGADPVIAFDGRGEPYREDGVEWWPLRHSGGVRTRVPLRPHRLLEAADLLVLNSAWTIGNLRVGSCARRLGVPYVLAPRGAYDPLIMARRRLLKRLWWWLFERRLVDSAAAIHVFFSSQREQLAELGYRGPALIAPNGVRVPAGRRWDGGSSGRVVFLGRFDPEHKGLDLLLGAMALLPTEERPLLHLSGPDWRGGKAEVRSMVGALDLEGHVDIGPPVYDDDKWTLLASSLGLVYPSRWEWFGNSLAEAAALGVPTLATPYPLALYLAERHACTVVEAEPAALAEGLRSLLRIAARRGASAPVTEVADYLDWSAVARQWLDQLELIAAPSSRRS
jgi:glycosyltransferase involved in cell wall biosynthesis